MSCSSESDVTISMQDSSPEPSSPPNHLLKSRGSSKGGRQEQGGCGIENKGYLKDTTLEVETPLDTNIVNLIPAKPSPHLGPFEPLNDYFIPINHHKKFLRRSEKLYVTKSTKSKKGRNWGRLFCGGFGCFVLAALVALAVLIILDVVHLPLTGQHNNDQTMSELMASSTPGGTSYHPSSTTEFEASSHPHVTTPQPATSSIYLKNTADVEFSIENEKYEGGLANKSSTPFNHLALQLQRLVIEMLGESIQHESVVAKVQEFTPESGGESIYTKLRLGWSDESLTLQGIQYALRNVSTLGLGNYSLKRLKYFDVVNLCKFNNNGCSHNCSFHAQQLQFQCSCPDPFLLSTDLKTCVQITQEEITTTSTTQESIITTDAEQSHPPPHQGPVSTMSSSTPTTTTIQPEVQPEVHPTISTMTASTSTTTGTTTTTTESPPPAASIVEEITEESSSSKGQDDDVDIVTEQAGDTNTEIESTEPIQESSSSTTSTTTTTPPPEVAEVAEESLGDQTETSDANKMTDNNMEITTITSSMEEVEEVTEPVM